MDDCPHCGEPLEDDAESCAHCGSDFETGWRPDADDYQVDLPEDDAVEEPARMDLGWQDIGGMTLVLASALTFIWAGARWFGAAVMPFTMLLGLSLWLFHRWLRAGRKA